MSCAIIYDKNKNAVVTAPNGESSNLFNQLEKITGSNKSALDKWSMQYVDRVTDKLGDYSSLTEKEVSRLKAINMLDKNGEMVLFYKNDEGISSDISKNVNKNVTPLFLSQNNMFYYDSLSEMEGSMTASIGTTNIDQYIDSLVDNGYSVVFKEPNGSLNVKTNDSNIFVINEAVNPIEVLSRKTTRDDTSQQVEDIIDNLSEDVAIALSSELAENLGLGEDSYEVISENEAKELTGDNKVNYDGQPGFMYKGKVYLVSGKFDKHTALHEFSHIVIRSLLKHNKALFNKIYNDVMKTDAGKQFSKEAIAEYGEDSDLTKEEVIVKALTEISKKEDITPKEKTFLDKVIFALKNLFRKVFGAKNSISSLSYNTTIDELYQMFSSDSLDVSAKNLVNDTDMAFMAKALDVKNDLIEILGGIASNESLAPGHKTLISSFQKLTNEMKNSISSSSARINKSDFNKEILSVLKTDEGVDLMREMQKSASKHLHDEKIGRIDEDMTDDQNAMREVAEQMSAVINHISNIGDSLPVIERYLEEIMMYNVTSNKTLEEAYVFIDVIQNWIEFLKKTAEGAKKSNKGTSKVFMEYIGEFKWQAENLKDKFDEVLVGGIKHELYKNWAPLYESVSKQLDAEVAKIERVIALRPNRKNKSLHASLAKAKSNRFRLPSKAKFEDYIKVKGIEDISGMSAWLENYISISDPIVASLSKYIKKELSDEETTAYQRYVKFTLELRKLMEKAGMDIKDIKDITRTLTFEDESVLMNQFGHLDKFMVTTLINEHKGHKFALGEMTNNINDISIALKEAIDPKEVNGVKPDVNPEEVSDLNKELTEALQNKKEHIRTFFNGKHTEKYNNAYDVFETEKGKIAKEKRQSILDMITDLKEGINENTATTAEVDQNIKEIDALWTTFSYLGSLYDEYGNLKEEGTEEHDIALTIKLFKEKSRGFFTYSADNRLFQMAYDEFELLAKLKIESKGITEPSAAYDLEYDALHKAWVKDNTSLSFSDGYLKAKNNIMSQLSENNIRLQELLGEEESTDNTFEKIVDQVKNEKNELNEIEVDTFSPEKQKELIRLEQKTIDEKANNENSAVSKDDLEFYTENLPLRKGLSTEEKARIDKVGEIIAIEASISSLYEALNYLRSKVPNTKFDEIMGNFTRDNNLRLTAAEKKLTYAEMIKNKKVFAKLKKVQGFEEFASISTVFKKYSYVNRKTGKTVNVVERGVSYAWLKEEPISRAETKEEEREEGYIKTIEVSNSKGELIEMNYPSFKYMERTTNPELFNGYDETTGLVNDKDLKDNLGNWKPKTEQQMKDKVEYQKELNGEAIAEPYRYINQEFTSMRNNHKDQFAVLQHVTAYHLDNQRGVASNKRLDFETARYRGLAYEKGTPVEIVKRMFHNSFSDLVVSADDFETGLNAIDVEYENDGDYQRSDNTIPVTGKYGLTIEQSSFDVLGGIVKYGQSTARYRALKKTQSITRATAEFANRNKPVDKMKWKVAERAARAATEGYRLAHNLISSKDNKRLKSHSNLRSKVLQSIYEVNHQGKKMFDTGASNNVLLNESLKAVNTAATLAFFSLDVLSAGKNFGGAMVQLKNEALYSKHLNPGDLARGLTWISKVPKLTYNQTFSSYTQPLNLQLIALFDAVQGDNSIMAPRAISNTGVRELAHGGLTGVATLHRRALEKSVTLTMFSAYMHAQRIEMIDKDGNIKNIPYINAWVKNKVTGQIELKPGIDSKYDINGDEFFAVKLRLHELSNHVQGSYSDFDTPMFERYALSKLVMKLRKYFSKMAYNRWGGWYGEKYSIVNEDIHIGYQVDALQSLVKLSKIGTGQWRLISKQNVKNITRTVMEFANRAVVLTLAGIIFGFFIDDDDKWNKLMSKSGPIETWLTRDDLTYSLKTASKSLKIGREFKGLGFAENYMLALMLSVSLETSSFTSPLALLSTVKTSSISISTIENAIKLINEFSGYVLSDKDGNRSDSSVYYQKNSGDNIYETKHSPKYIKTLLQTLGMGSKNTSVVQTIKTKILPYIK